MNKEEIEKMYDEVKIYQGNVSIETPETLYIKKLQQELNQKNKIIEEIKEDIDFVRKIVCQELYMSKDERTRTEMDRCYHILTEALEKGSEDSD